MIYGIRKSIGIMLMVGFIIQLATGIVLATVYADKESKFFHLNNCPEKAKIKPRNLRVLFSEPEAESKGFYPCEICITPYHQASFPNPAIKKLALPVDRQKAYIGDEANKIFHNDFCYLVKAIPGGSRRTFDSPRAAAQAGYQPCTECGPPSMFIRRTTITKPAADLKKDQGKQTPVTATAKPNKLDALPDEMTP